MENIGSKNIAHVSGDILRYKMTVLQEGRTILYLHIIESFQSLLYTISSFIYMYFT